MITQLVPNRYYTLSNYQDLDYNPESFNTLKYINKIDNQTFIFILNHFIETNTHPIEGDEWNSFFDENNIHLLKPFLNKRFI